MFILWYFKDEKESKRGKRRENSEISKRKKLDTIDPLHKWRLNLNNNTWYILSLTLMFQDKGIFT